LDYGMFTPIQVAAIAALEGDQSCVTQINTMYRSRRDVLCEGLNAAGWPVTPPKATMFVWAKLPDFYREMSSVEFSKKLLTEARVAVSPGIGFGEYGEGYVRFGLIENEHRTRQAIRSIKRMIKNDGFA
jgi:alanine-synthesizing transaminase